MEPENDRFYLWKYVLSISDSITNDVRNRNMTNEDLLNYLESIEEAFGKMNDPLSDFQGFVLCELCRSIRRSIFKNK